MSDPLQLARDGAEYLRTGKGRHVTMDEVIAALDAAIAQRGEPAVDAVYAAWHGAGVDIAGGNWKRFSGMLPPLYTAPPARVPFTPAQRRRLYDNSPEHHADAKSFASFERIVSLAERAHGITGA